jgi:hypothetical protein
MNATDFTTSADEVARIGDQFQRAWDGDAWHGPPVAPLLASLDQRSGSYRPAPDAHTAQELASHITFWLDAAHRRLKGEKYLPTEGDWDLPAGESWSQTVARLSRTYAALVASIAATPASRLNEPVTGMPYNIYVLLHGALQHTLYHAGQIAMLRRLAGELRVES